jgi:transcriptional regulator
VTDAPVDYIDGMLRAIVGLEIVLTSLVGKWKVSQNRPAGDREGVARGLADIAGSDAAAMAREVLEPGHGG